jgi:hypothetical protein
MLTKTVTSLLSFTLFALALSACGVSVLGSGDNGGDTNGNSMGADTGAACGEGGSVCAEDEFCDYRNNACGDGFHVCVKMPDACDDVYIATCGCDGKVHENPCEANGKGVDISDRGGCQAPSGTFGCGAHFCQIGTEYCWILGSDIVDTPSQFSCVPAPSSCSATPDCACVADQSCGNICEITPDGGLQIFCPGG